MQKIRTNWIHGVLAVTVLATACGGTTDPTPSGPPRASIERIADVGNSANSSDLFISVFTPSDETSVTEYRIMVTPQGAAFDVAAANAVPVDRYTVLATGRLNPSVILPSDVLDTAGDPIGEGTAYVVHVLVVVSGTEFENQLSPPSSSITLAQTNIVLTLTDPIQAGSGGMAVDAAGNIYSADFGLALSGAPGTRVFKITPTGEVTVFATGLIGASGNAFDSQGNLFQSNIGGNRISRITPDGTVTTFVTDGIAGPVGIAIDANDNLFVANCSNNTIRRVAVDGTSTEFSASALFSCPNGIALADDGNLYVANFNDGSVIKVAPDGAATSFVQIPGSNNGHITWANGVLYVVARSANQIYQLTLAGELTLLAGSGTRGLWDGAALESRLSLTNDIAVSPDGSTLYFNDVVNQSGTNIISPVVIRRLILVE